MDYEITSSTLIIMASELGSIVYDYEGKHLIKLSTGKLIEDNCKNYGSSFKGRKDGTKALTGIRYKTPIIISELNRIIFFPTTSTLSIIPISSSNSESFAPCSLTLVDKANAPD